MDMQCAHGTAAWTGTRYMYWDKYCSMDMDTQHMLGHTAWTWTRSIYWDMQNGHGYAAWTWLAMQYGQVQAASMLHVHVDVHAACPYPCCMSQYILLSMPMLCCFSCPCFMPMLHVHVYFMSMSMLHVHVSAKCSSSWSTNMDMDMQHRHGHGQAACTATCRKDMQHGNLFKGRLIGVEKLVLSYFEIIWLPSFVSFRHIWKIFRRNEMKHESGKTKFRRNFFLPRNENSLFR
jgi:hypothetical protein